jgi:hypothetical protein
MVSRVNVRFGRTAALSDLDQQFVERGVIRHLGVDVAGEADYRELIALTRWVRLRLRAALWRQWKTPRRRHAALIALRVLGELRNTAGSGRGPWHIARSKALSIGLSNAYFRSLGLPSLIEAR